MGQLSFKGDFTGEAILEDNIRVPRGFYLAIYDSIPDNDKLRGPGKLENGGNSWQLINFAVKEGPSAGGKVGVMINLADSNHPDPAKKAAANDKARAQFKGLLIKGGADASKFTAKMDLSEDNLKGKTWYIFFEPKDEALGRARDLTRIFLDKAAWEAAKAADVGPAAAKPAAAAKDPEVKVASQTVSRSAKKTEEVVADSVATADEGAAMDLVDGDGV